MTINSKSQRFVWIAVVMLALTAASFAQIGVGVAVSFGPPPLPVYAQPLCPGEGYIWTPGYWAYDPGFGDYYWVPGTWVMAPQVGFLWTPGWWGWGGSGFLFHACYWGPVVGFYGGINYGFGYFGHGYQGGRWENNHFYYNRAVNNVNVTNSHNVYNTRVVNNTSVNRVSYNGGHGGIAAQPTPQEQAAARANHIPPVAAQTEHAQTARSNPQLRASVNKGKPPIAATPKPAAFQGSGVVSAKQSGGPYTPPPNRASNQPKANKQTQAARPQNNNVPRPPENNAQAAQTRPNPQTSTPQNNQTARQQNDVPRPSTAVHPNELPPIPRPPAANTGNNEQDQKYQQQQEQLRAQQQQERQKLQQQQEQEHQQLAQQKSNQAKQQQLEQQHQQQTQKLQQQHQQQQQQMARQQQQQMQGRQQQAHASQPQPPKERP